MLLLKRLVCNSKKSEFLKEQEARGLLSRLGIRTPLSHIPFCRFCFILIILNKLIQGIK